MGNNNGKLTGNPGKEHIRFRSGMVSGFPSGDTHVGFEMVNGPLHDRPDFIEGNPFVRTPLDAGKHAEVHVFVSISSAAFFGSAAWILTITYPLSFDHVYFWADPFVAVRASFFMAVPGIFHIEGAVPGTGGVTVNVISDLFKCTFISQVIRDQCFGKVEFLFKETISFNGIKSGIAEEGIRVEAGVQGEEIRENRL